MMYLLDKNILTRSLKENEMGRSDLCITQDIVEESGFTQEDIQKIKISKISILKFHKTHFEKLKEVVEEHGGNLRLLNLYLGEGTADIMMIAFVLAEKEADRSMFPEEYTIVTKDAELTKVACSYGIKCVQEIETIK